MTNKVLQLADNSFYHEFNKECLERLKGKQFFAVFYDNETDSTRFINCGRSDMEIVFDCNEVIHRVMNGET